MLSFSVWDRASIVKPETDKLGFSYYFDIPKLSIFFHNLSMKIVTGKYGKMNYHILTSLYVIQVNLPRKYLC